MLDYSQTLIKDGLLQDEESRFWFNMRMRILIETGSDFWSEYIMQAGARYKCYEIDSLMKKGGYDGIIIYGAGRYGEINYNTLKQSGIIPVAFCDRDEQLRGKTKFDIPIIGIEDLIKVADKYLTVISLKSPRICKEIEQDLLKRGIPEENLLIPEASLLIGNKPGQYFDVFNDNHIDAFADLGMYTGDTLDSLIKRTNNSFDRYYGIEGIKQFYEKARARFPDDERLEFFNYAVSDRNGTEEMTMNSFGSFISGEMENYGNGEKETVPCITLDELLGDRRLSFIKMDIEGSEYKAILGAEKIIREQKPKLAISLYHKPQDIVTILPLIHDMVPEYRFWLRHYSTVWMETVLYASV